MWDWVRHCGFLVYKRVLRDNPLLWRRFHSRKLRLLRFGELSGWRLYSALSDNILMSWGLYEHDAQRWLKGKL